MSIPSNEDIKEVIEFYSNDFFKDFLKSDRYLKVLTNVAKAYLEASAQMPEKNKGTVDTIGHAVNITIWECTLAHMKIVAEKDKEIAELQRIINYVDKKRQQPKGTVLDAVSNGNSKITTEG